MVKRYHTTRTIYVIIIVLILLTLPTLLFDWSSVSASGAQPNLISNHWSPGQRCFQDELNKSDIDYYNCWLDNTGKILTSSELTGDVTDANNALLTLTRYGLNSSNSYLPEAVVNSSDLSSSGFVTNRIAMLQASNQSSTLEKLTIGSYYAGDSPLGYIGSDRLLINGNIYRSTNATVYQTAQGFVKRSLFSTPSGSFYLYVNATVIPGNPYVSITMQVLPLSTPMNSSDILYLQLFSNSGQFDNATLYDTSGNYVRPLTYNAGSLSSQNGTIIAYSKQDNVFTEDSVAINFNNTNAQVDDFEHWYQNAAFDSLSWFGIAYNSPGVSAGNMSAPIYVKVYPIDHMDYHLVNDTAKYIAENVKNTTVSPPVGFGFIAYGLALASEANRALAPLANSYWNYYYSRYAGSVYYTPYARSINTFALAGFALYGCNSTVEQFTRNFLGNTSGGSIEETGWAVAATYRLKTCTGLASDAALYHSFINSFVTNSQSFSGVTSDGGTRFVAPSATFEFGEAAAGLMLGGVTYNNPVVLSLMSAVYQSNLSGTILNYHYHGDLANTETLPAYILSTQIFQESMDNATRYFITGFRDANLTSIDFKNGTLLIGAIGDNGSIYVSHDGLVETYNINGRTILPISIEVTTVADTTTIYSVSTSTNTTTVTHVTTTTSTTTTTKSSSSGFVFVSAGLILAIFGIGVLAYSIRKQR